jgi:hypothetical protein
MKITITPTILEEVNETCGEAVERIGTDRVDPSDPVYIKIANAPRTKSGCVIDADSTEVAELRSRAEFDIEVCKENLGEGCDLPYWRGRLAAYRALLKQVIAGALAA